MERESILVVGAHPDDVDFSTAGTMTKWARDGKDIYYVICTSGNRGGTRSNYTPEELVAIRKREQEAAAAVVGAKKMFFLGYNDGELEVTKQLKKELVRCIRMVRPGIVFSFDPGNTKFDNFHLYHSDHRACGLATFDAVYPAAANRLFFPELEEEGLQPYRVPEMYFFGTYEPNIWVDITDVMEQKIQVIRCHESQFNGERAAQVEESVRTRSKAAAFNTGFEYAESFRMIRYPY